MICSFHLVVISLSISFFKDLVYLIKREGERESTSRRSGRERGRSTPPAEQDPRMMTLARDRGLMDWATQVPSLNLPLLFLLSLRFKSIRPLNPKLQICLFALSWCKCNIFDKDVLSMCPFFIKQWLNEKSELKCGIIKNTLNNLKHWIRTHGMFPYLCS